MLSLAPAGAQSETPQNAYCYQHFLPCYGKKPYLVSADLDPSSWPLCFMWTFWMAHQPFWGLPVSDYRLVLGNKKQTNCHPAPNVGCIPGPLRSADQQQWMLEGVWNHNNSAEALEGWVKFIALPVSLEFGSWPTEAFRSLTPSGFLAG